MYKVNSFINRFFGVILLISAASGLFFRINISNITNIIIISLAVIIFSSFFKIELNRDLFREDMKNTVLYLVLRFIVLPVIVYFFVQFFSPFYAVVFFILLVLPAAVSSPAFTAMYNGKISLSLKILIITSFLSILTLPFLSGLVLSKKIEIDTVHMFLTMIYTIVIPFILHLPLRRNHKIRKLFTDNNPLITAIGLIIIFIVATSNNRYIILSEPLKIFNYTLLSFLVYIVLYITGYFLIAKQNKETSIAYSVSSGANNIGIGVTITALYFPGDTNVFMIVAQIAWIFALIPMRYFFRKMK
jgi:predicted Na+-dependent transporter